MNTLSFINMIIKDFKCFKGKHKFQLQRPPGLYYMSGINKLEPGPESNGAGKTSLWDALVWCLTGRTGKDNRPAEAIVPWEDEDATTKVIVKWRNANKLCKLKRSRHPNKLMLSLDGGEYRSIEQPEVFKHLGMSEDVLRRAIVLAQFEKLFMEMRPEQQSQLFNQALPLGVWLKASEIAGKKRKRYDTIIEAAKLFTAETKGKLIEARKTIKQVKAEAENQTIEHSERIAEFKRCIANNINERKKIFKEAGVVDAAALLNQVSDTRKTLDKLRDVVAECLVKRRGAVDKATQHRDKIDGYEKSITHGQGYCPECGQEVSNDHIKTKVETLTRLMEKEDVRFKNYDDKHTDALKKANKVDRKLIGMLDYQNKIHDLSSDHKLLLDQLANAKQDKNSPQRKTLKTLRDRRDNLKQALEKLEADLKHNERRARICDYWIDAFKEIRISLIDQVLDELGMAVSKHIESLGLHGWQIKFKTERENKSGSVTTMFSVLLYPPGREKPVKWESYSGGESQRWQLAVAFGLSEIVLARAGVLPNIEVLDEPTKGLSPKGTEDLLEHLNNRAKELGRAIYLVEQHSLESGSFTNKIIIQKSEQGSVILES